MKKRTFLPFKSLDGELEEMICRDFDHAISVLLMYCNGESLDELEISFVDKDSKKPREFNKAAVEEHANIDAFIEYHSIDDEHPIVISYKETTEIPKSAVYEFRGILAHKLRVELKRTKSNVDLLAFIKDQASRSVLHRRAKFLAMFGIICSELLEGMQRPCINGHFDQYRIWIPD